MPANFDAPDALILEGMLLLAHPDLQGTYFGNTVILISHHDPECGAHGYVLNQPMGQLVAELAPTVKEPEIALLPVYMGGPVEQSRIMFATLAWQTDGRGKLHFQTHLPIAEAAARSRQGEQVLAIAGYSGWSAGQLERELEHHSWIVRPPTAHVADTNSILSLWDALTPDKQDVKPLAQLVARRPTEPLWN
jgi:putative transcriptional regulator